MAKYITRSEERMASGFDRILKIANECFLFDDDGKVSTESVIRFALKIERSERECCARLADLYANVVDKNDKGAPWIADAIRARGEINYA